MNTLISDFNRAYPVYASTSFEGSCIVEEPDNLGKDALQQLVLTGFSGYGFPHELVAKTASFANSAQPLSSGEDSIAVMRLDCDKIILFERDGQKYMLFCELKSTFSADVIAKAKDQIVGSIVKMRSLLQTLQTYNFSEYKPIGLIVSFQPTEEQMNMVSKNEDHKSAFAVRLHSKKKYTMPSSRTNRYFYPLNVGDVDLFYFAVPDRQKSYKVDINSIIR